MKKGQRLILLSPCRTGGVWSSTRDLSDIGRSILRSSLIPAAQTRRWMKPVVHTASLLTSIGAPWEIKRVNVQPSGRIVDLYSKDGKLGAYSSYLILVPDYNVGFTILGAGQTSNSDVLVGFVADVFLSALEESARVQAAQVFVGQYKDDSGGGNSTVTLTSNDNLPGLSLVNWVNNGTAFPALFPIFLPLAEGNADEAKALFQAYLNGTILINPEDISVRLYPTGLRSPIKDGGERVAFRAVFGFISSVIDSSPFSDSMAAWVIADAVIYGKSGADEFIFTLDNHGKVIDIEHPFSRKKMMKIEKRF
jgi:hypothetical protein